MRDRLPTIRWRVPVPRRRFAIAVTTVERSGRTVTSKFEHFTFLRGGPYAAVDDPGDCAGIRDDVRNGRLCSDAERKRRQDGPGQEDGDGKERRQDDGQGQDDGQETARQDDGEGQDDGEEGRQDDGEEGRQDDGEEAIGLAVG